MSARRLPFMPLTPVVSLTAASLLLASGCASGPSAGSGDDPVNSGLAGLRPAGEGAGGEAADDEAVARLLDDSERLYNDLWSMDGSRPALGDSPALQTEEEVGPADEPEPVSLQAMAPDAGPAEPGAEPDPTGAGDAEARVRALVSELATALREDPDADPYLLAVRLAGLTAAGLSASEAEAVIEGLAIDERETARAVLDVLTATGGDPSALADAFAERADRLREARPIRISRAALCSRVEGFGRFTELPGTSFVAGAPMRMIVYTEVEHFDHSPPPPSGSATDWSDWAAWEIRLSQELLLYHESDGLLAWRQPEEVTVYRPKTRMRDFFVVNTVELPRSLTVGAYRLKVVMRDLADGSVDERIVPISVVADPRLADGYGG